MIKEINRTRIPPPLKEFLGDYAKALKARNKMDLVGESEYRCFKRFLDLYGCGKYKFAAKSVRRMFNFLHMLTITTEDGKYAPFELRPVQKFILCGIFGLRHPNGDYLTSIANIYIARRNGKSFLLSAVLHYLLTMSRFRQEEIILASCKGANATICFKEFLKFIDNDKQLAETFSHINRTAMFAESKITGNRMDLFRTGGGAKNQLDGFTNKVAVIDEEMLCDPIITQTINDGQAHFRDSLLVTMSTAQFDIGSDNHKEWLRKRKALYAGALPDNLFLFLADPDVCPGKPVDYTDVHVWGKANPVLLYKPDGYTLEDFQVNKYSAKAQAAVETKGFTLQSFATKQCNLWYSAEDRGLCTYDQMVGCGVSYSFDDCIKAGWKDWYLGIDLSHTMDLSSVSFLGFVGTDAKGALVKNDEHVTLRRLFVHTVSFMPTGRLQEHVDKDKFAYAGYVDKELYLCNGGGGDSIDTQQILQYLVKVQRDNDLHFVTIAADPYNIAGVQDGLSQMCDCFILQNQSPKSLSQYIEALSNWMKNGNIAYEAGHEDIWERAVTNSVLIRNPSGYYSLEKLTLRADSNIRIDPVDAMITGFIAPYIDDSRRGPTGDELVDDWAAEMGVKE